MMLNGVSWLRTGVILGLFSLVGCGGGAGDDLPTAKVKGTVTAGGKPVTEGEITFSPVKAGKNAGGTVWPDGSFTLTTYVKDDGAIIGQHKVTYTPAMIAVEANASGHTPTPVSPYSGMVPKEAEITISGGDNQVSIELIKK